MSLLLSQPGIVRRRATGEDPLEDQISDAATTGSLTALAIFLARTEDLTLVPGDRASVWVNHGTGGDATQGTDASRPTFEATGVNGMPCLSFDGGDSMVTAAIDSGADTAYALIEVFQDTDTAAKFVTSYGDIVSTGLALKTTGAGLGAQANRGGSGTSRAESAGTISMVAPEVVSVTLDTTLVLNETEVRHAGANVTSTRPVNGNPTGSLGSQIITIGAREGPANHATAKIASLVLLSGTGAWSGAQLTALTDIEALLQGHSGL